MTDATPLADASIEVTVPYQDRPLERPLPDRLRRLRRHLLEALRDLRAAKRPDRLIQPHPPDPPEGVKAILQASCAACQGHCCLGGGEHAWLDERTMARVRRDRPDLDARGIIAAYVRQVAEFSYAGSCLFHGSAGCTLDATMRADLCSSFYCDGLKAFLRRQTDRRGATAQVVVRTVEMRPIAHRSSA